MPHQRFMTLERHIIENERRFPEATGELSALLSDLALAAKIISLEVNKAGLVDILGFTGDTNIHGEQVKKLDVFAHEMLIRAMDHGGHLCVMASEEEEQLIHIPAHRRIGKYVLLFDPLDGSSNIDVNISIGTIFSIYKRKSAGEDAGRLEDCLQKGSEQIAAGYIVYGSSTILVYSTGNGVYGFTLDPSVGEFLLSHENIRIPTKGRIYSINEGNYLYWEDGLKKYIKYLQQHDKETGRPYTGRYIGSLVADFHRNMIYGGIFMYPKDNRNPNGKLRLMYECNPLAFIVEQAGGKASDGYTRILDIQPKELHQRVPLFIGSLHDMRIAEEFVQGQRDLESK
jgi:fructose-1,6-bisphosphatase I